MNVHDLIRTAYEIDKEQTMARARSGDGRHNAVLHRDIPGSRVAYWDDIDSPVGRLHLATGEDGRVRRISFRVERESFIDGLLEAGWLPLRDREANALLELQLAEYFGGERRQFTLDCDLDSLSVFTRSVLAFTASVGAGGWETYGSVAAMIGHPRAARAVGNALGDNPIPIVIPCHRVLAAGGRIGGYAGRMSGGLEIKRTLLGLEGVHPSD